MTSGLELPLLTLVLLVLAAFLAGWVDSVVGGGGLIQLPALLLGLPAETPVATIGGTNKLPSMSGTAVAAGTYARTIRMDWATGWPLLVGAALGSSVGAQLARFIPRQHFTPIVLVVVVAVGWYTWRRPELGRHTVIKHTGRDAALRLGALGLGVGGWDGLIGPGTGAFFVLGIVAVIGHEFLTATMWAKLANLTTNLAALISFGVTGHVLWGLGIMMAVGNVAGGFLGARTALKHGNGFVRRVFLIVVGALAIKLAWDTLQLFV